MNQLLLKWFNDLANRRSLVIQETVLVGGVRDKVLGPRSDFAAIEVLCEPAEEPELEVSAANKDEAKRGGYLDQAVYGLLDVLLTQSLYPLRNVRITVTKFSIDPIKSSQMAFRLAGRDAGSKILEAVTKGGKAEREQHR
jgi:hypothetical protein